MSNELYCNVIVWDEDALIEENFLLVGDEVNQPLGEAAEKLAVDKFNEKLNESDRDYSSELAGFDLEAALEEGVLETTDSKIAVSISWPTVIKTGNPQK
jgi:hypothetical protein